MHSVIIPQMVALHQWLLSSACTSNVFICIYLYRQRTKIKFCIHYCLIVYDMVITKPEEAHVPHAGGIKAAWWASNACGNLTFSWWSYWTCGVSWSPEIPKPGFQWVCVSCSGWLVCVVIQRWSMSKFSLQENLQLHHPGLQRVHMWKIPWLRKELLYCLEVRFTIRALITMLFYVSVDFLLSVSKKHACTCSLLH